jgi:hypothetical protein
MDMQREELKISFKNHIAQAWPSLIYIIALLVMPIYFKGKYEESTFEMILNFSIYISLFLFIPQILIHIKYHLVNRSTQITSVANQDGFTIKSQSINKHVLVSEINQIVLVKSFSAYFNGLRVIPSDNYFYGLIYLKSNEVILITTLLDNELIWLSHLKPKSTTCKRKLFCINST